MATKTKSKKSGVPPVKARGATRSERLRQGVLDWHAASYGAIRQMMEIAYDLLDELDDEDSPFHEILDGRRELKEFVTALDEATCAMVSMFTPLIASKEANIPNPTALL